MSIQVQGLSSRALTLNPKNRIRSQIASIGGGTALNIVPDKESEETSQSSFAKMMKSVTDTHPDLLIDSNRRRSFNLNLEKAEEE